MTDPENARTPLLSYAAILPGESLSVPAFPPGSARGVTLMDTRRIGQRHPLPPPDAGEIAAIITARSRVSVRAPRFTVQTRQGKDGRLGPIVPQHSDAQGWIGRLEDAFGTSGVAFPTAQLNHLIRACQDGEGKLDTVKLNAMLAVIDSTRPENELQAMLAVQMALTHSMALDLLRRTQRVDQIPQVDSAGSLAIKLLRTFTMQVEALAKLQRGGEQVVKVVHVHAGVQAIVGTVQAGTGVGGGANEN